MIKLDYLKDEDIEKVVEWNSNKSSDFLLKWGGLQYKYPLTHEQIVQRISTKTNSNTNIYKIISEESEEMIGTIELDKIDKINRTARVCRFLIGNQELRGKGIGKEVLANIFKLAFIDIKLLQITIGVFDFNESAIRCYESVGFKKVKHNINSVKAENGFWSSYEMAITREEWINKNVLLKSGQLELLNDIKPLWEELIEHHRDVSKIFRQSFENRRFEDRASEFRKKADTHEFRIELVRFNGEEGDIGYSISSISSELTGEIDSIYLNPLCRGLGIGDILMKNALEWMDSKDAKTKKISVAFENDYVLSFYEKYGFKPRSLILEQICE